MPFIILRLPCSVVTYPSLVASLIILFSNSSFASKGGLNKDGCHTDKETKKYHCHNKKNKKDKKDKKNKKNKKN